MIVRCALLIAAIAVLAAQGGPNARAGATLFGFTAFPYDYSPEAVNRTRLYAKMPPGSEVMQLWRNIGLLDGHVRPKPAWEIWRAGVVR